MSYDTSNDGEFTSVWHDNVVGFPHPNKIDKQFVELETQREEIERQRKLIKEKTDEKTD
tara:strand:+ start:107 stop:283 length:177 start_codon:yes stop_codon:yes gene_type:complete